MDLHLENQNLRSLQFWQWDLTALHQVINQFITICFITDGSQKS